MVAVAPADEGKGLANWRFAVHERCAHLPDERAKRDVSPTDLTPLLCSFYGEIMESVGALSQKLVAAACPLKCVKVVAAGRSPANSQLNVQHAALGVRRLPNANRFAFFPRPSCPASEHRCTWDWRVVQLRVKEVTQGR